MKNIRLTAILFLFVVLALNSCSKNNKEDKKDSLKIENQNKKSNKVDSLKQAVFSIQDIAKVLKANNVHAQNNTIDANQDKTLTFEGGTIINIKANSFVFENTGKAATGKIQIKVSEYYNTSDILLAGLTTTSDGKTLETGGMLNIEATAQNNKLKLKEGANIEIIFPSKTMQGMKLFYGTWDNNSINWKATNDIPVIQKKTTKQESITYYANIDNMPQYPGGDDKFIEVSCPEIGLQQSKLNSGL